MTDVAIIGMGYVGAELAHAILTKTQLAVVGIDPRQAVSPSDRLSNLLSTYGSRFSLEPRNQDAPQSIDTVLICVGTPLDGAGHPYFGEIESSLDGLDSLVAPDGLVVLESTVSPGTTRNMIGRHLIANGRKDVHIGYSSERVDPGNTKYDVQTTPKVVAAQDNASLPRVREFYSQFVSTVVASSSLETAEAAKLLENTFRLLNISWVNELATLFQGTEINFYEALDLADTKPFGFMKFSPSVGAGGHCIPVDPLFLQSFLESKLTRSKLVDLAIKINDERPYYLAQEIGRSLTTHEPKVLLLGLTYKAETNDTRESKSLAVARELNRLGAKVSCYDEFVHHEDQRKLGIEPISKQEAIAAQWDAVIVVVAHKHIKELVKEISAARIFSLTSDVQELGWTRL